MRRTNKEILQDIVSCLGKLVPMAKTDSTRRWGVILENRLEEALQLQKAIASDDDVREFCGGIRSLYDGRDEALAVYQPLTYHPETGRYSINSGTESFPEVRNHLYQYAEEIRIIGEY